MICPFDAFGRFIGCYRRETLCEMLVRLQARRFVSFPTNVTLPFESTVLFSLLSALSALAFEILASPLVDVDDETACLEAPSPFDTFLTRLENVDSTFFFFIGDCSAADDSGGLLFFRLGSYTARNENNP